MDATQTEAARLLVEEADHCLATWRDFVILLWRRDTTADGVAALRRILQLAATHHPRGICLFTIVEASAPPPASDVRDALAAVLAEFSRVIRFSAVAYEGAGFRAAMVRGVVAGLTLLARMAYPHEVFAGVHDAARWIAGQLAGAGTPLSDDDVEAVVAELRRRLPAPS